MPYVTAGDLRIQYEVEGAGEPLVLVHGFTDSLATWYELGYVDVLAPNYKVILVDMLGHGGSDKPHDPDVYGSTAMARHVVAVLDELHVPSAHFFGYSM